MPNAVRSGLVVRLHCLADLTVSTDIGGTDGFRAPESYDCASYATDIYSAGCTLALQVRVH